jgi:spermidine synthase
LTPARVRFWLLAALIVFFFCSGLSALIYQVLWLRMLGWVFGVTIYAASAVWATFMAGLAIGSMAAGRLADRVRNPLRWFGATEMLIGVTALATPQLLDALQQVYVAAFPSLPGSLGAVTAVRLAIAVGVLIVPTVLMGATLPLVLKASAFRSSVLGREVGLLYGSNAAGAIAGTLMAGLYLIPERGIHQSFLAAAALNLLVGASAVGLSLRGRGLSRLEETSTDAAAAPSVAAGEARVPRLWIVLVVFTLSGAVSLALEVVWFRVLTLFIRPTVYAFSLMLATILAGIAIGSYLATPLLARRKMSMVLLGALELAIGVAVVLSFGPLIYLNSASMRLAPLLSRVMPEYLVYPLTGSLLAIFPTALLMGLAFPIGLHLWANAARDGEHVAGRVGMFYSLNVAGAIAGSLAGGFLLLPRLGSESSIVLLASVTVGSGLLLLAGAEGGRAARAAIAVVGVAAFAAGVSRSPDPFVQFNAQRYPGMRTLWQEEGVEATVTVHEFGEGSGARRLMTVNGTHQAGTDYPTTRTHRWIGHLPMAVHPGARKALVIGLGGGATAGAVSIHDGVEVDIVELAESVVHGAALFESINYGVLTRPNVRLRVDDARNYMMLTPERYDVITADVIQPIYAGSGNLYSVEYFTLMRRVLKPGGIVMQWVPGTEAEFKLIARTFASVFPATTAWAGGSLLVGRVEPLTLRRSEFDWKLGVPGRAQGLKDLGVESFEALLAHFTAGPHELRAFVGPGPLLTDDRPLAEYFLSLPRDRQPDLASLRGDVAGFVAPD